MKLAVVAASLLASVNGQIVHNTAKKLDARCLFENDIEKLVIDIPYPGADKANILALAAGTCDEISFLTAANDGGRKDVGVDEDMVHLVIPIDACGIRGDVYKIPTVTRSFGLIKPTANVTFGQNIAGQDVIFRYLPIAAECGTRTSYTVEFEYNDVKSADTEGCTDVDGVCVFPAYGEEATFAIKEYTSNDYDVEVDDTNRARTAGEEIFLSMQVTDLTTDLKFAVTECILKQKNDTSSDGITLLNPGEVYNSSVVGSEHPSCEISGIDLRGTYDGFTKFNFQHILFLLDATTDTNSFTLQCTIEVCSRDDASSVCNRAAAVCMNDSIDLTDSTAVAEKDRLMENWMCDSLCGVGKEDACVVDADTVSCKACTCANGVAGIGSTCPVTNTEVCLSCDSGYYMYKVKDTCLINTCTCDHGTLGNDCQINNDEVCSACDDGYTLTGTVCVMNACSCTHGTAATGSDCLVDGDEVCSACESDYDLSGKVCAQTTKYGCGCARDPVVYEDAGCPADSPAVCQLMNHFLHRTGFVSRGYTDINIKPKEWLVVDDGGGGGNYEGPMFEVFDNGAIFQDLKNFKSLHFERGVGVFKMPAYSIISDTLTELGFEEDSLNSKLEQTSIAAGLYTTPAKACDSDGRYEHRLRPENIHDDAFKGVPNLKFLSLRNCRNMETLDPAWVAKNIPSLENIDIRDMMTGSKLCECGGLTGAAGRKTPSMCNDCAVIKWCQALCGVHPKMNSCHGVGHSIKCDQSNTVRNGTWYKASHVNLRSGAVTGPAKTEAELIKFDSEECNHTYQYTFG